MTIYSLSDGLIRNTLSYWSLLTSDTELLHAVIELNLGLHCYFIIKSKIRNDYINDILLKIKNKKQVKKHQAAN